MYARLNVNKRKLEKENIEFIQKFSI